MDEFSSSQVRPLGSQHVPSLPPLHSSSQSSDVALQPSNVDSFGYQWSQHVPPPPLPPSTRSYGSQYVPQPLPTPSQFSGVVLQPLIVGSGPQHVPPPPPLPTYSQSSDVALQPSNVGSVGDQGSQHVPPPPHLPPPTLPTSSQDSGVMLVILFVFVGLIVSPVSNALPPNPPQNSSADEQANLKHPAIIACLCSNWTGATIRTPIVQRIRSRDSSKRRFFERVWHIKLLHKELQA
uniref:Uncharacterized protein n=1 Tax=Ditylenchus dipsaci TaxID=166011 RepID=A0A915CXM3_9BILA